MSNEETSERPQTARGYKGPRWLIDRLPRFSSDTEAPEN
jgi:hypothetical protein